MELAFLIGGLLIGTCLVLTVRNTILLRKKEQPAEQESDEQKNREDEFNRLMNYRGDYK